MDGITAEASDAEDGEDAVWHQSTSVAQLLDATLWRQSGVGQGSKLFKPDVETLVDLDEIFRGRGKILTIAAVGAEPRPAAMFAWEASGSKLVMLIKYAAASVTGGKFAIGEAGHVTT